VSDVLYFKFSIQAQQETAMGPVHTTTEKFENVALFLRLGLPSTLANPKKLSTENGVFRKHSSNWRNLKTPGFRFRVDGKHIEKGAFRKRRRDNHVIDPAPQGCTQAFLPPVIVAFSNFCGV